MAVNVYTEWGPLKEVIVGDPMNFNVKGFDRIFQYLYQDQLALREEGKVDYNIAKRYILERQEDLDNFAKLLEKEGVRVRRPKKLKKPISIKTPFFKGIMNAVDDPRDMFLCIDDEIIETPPMNRNRYFEGLMLHHIFKEYFRKGARWTLAPRPKLSRSSFDNNHWSKIDKIHSLKEIEQEFDIAFDAANCLKFGKDIVMNVGNKNQELGAIWLQRHLGDKFRVHPVRITDLHIDGMLMPLRPGLMLINSVLKDRMHLLPKPLQKWETIEVKEEHVQNKFDYPKDHPQLASFLGMGVNVLSLDENTVCIRQENPSLKDTLESYGFRVIPVQLRHSELFGGCMHCVTLDVNRQEELQNYFDIF